MQFAAVNVGITQIGEGGAECDSTPTVVWAFTVLIVASVLGGVLGN
jgi:hypothetical protein